MTFVATENLNVIAHRHTTLNKSRDEKLFYLKRKCTCTIDRRYYARELLFHHMVLIFVVVKVSIDTSSSVSNPFRASDSLSSQYKQLLNVLLVRVRFSRALQKTYHTAQQKSRTVENIWISEILAENINAAIIEIIILPIRSSMLQ